MALISLLPAQSARRRMWLYLNRRCIDFVAGEQVRAPAFMQRTGTEWLWRLATNPRRLAVRYASCAVILADWHLFGRYANGEPGETLSRCSNARSISE